MSSVITLSADTTQLQQLISSSPASIFTKTLLAQDETLRGPGYRAPSVPVTGRRVTSDANVVTNSVQEDLRFPTPIAFEKSKRVVSKKTSTSASRNESRPISNPRSLKQTQKAQLHTKPPKSKHPLKPSPKRAPKRRKAAFKPSKNKSLNTSMDLSKAEAMINYMSDCPAPQNPGSKQSSIQYIVKQSLRKEKRKKIQAQKEEQEAKQQQDQLKEKLFSHNKQTRQDNLAKFRQSQFKPRSAWGIDEKKVTGVYDYEIRRQAEEIRRRRQEVRKRALSAGRDNIGLDTLSQVKAELNESVRKVGGQLKVQKKSKKPPKPSDPKIQAFIRLKKQQRKAKKEHEVSRVQYEENKRLTQLKRLEVHNRKLYKRMKPRRRSASSRKKSLYYDDFDDIEVIDIMNRFHDYNSDIDINQLDLSGMLDISGNTTIEKLDQKPKQPFTIAKTPDSPDSPGNFNHSSPQIMFDEEEGISDISFSDSEEVYVDINQRRLGKKLEPSLERQKWAISVIEKAWKSQLDYRTYQESQYRTNNSQGTGLNKSDFESEAYMSEDEEVQNIINKNVWKSDIEEINEDVVYKNFVESESENNESKLDNLMEVQKILYHEQDSALKQMKDKDILEMKDIAQQLGGNEQLAEYFQYIVERRYDQIQDMFRENAKMMSIAIDDPESISNSLQDRSSFARKLADEQAQSLNDNYSQQLLQENQEKFQTIFNELDFEESSENSFSKIHDPSTLSKKLRSISPLPELNMYSDASDSLEQEESEEDSQEDSEEVINVPFNQGGGGFSMEGAFFDIGSRSEAETQRDYSPMSSMNEAVEADKVISVEVKRYQLDQIPRSPPLIEEGHTSFRDALQNNPFQVQDNLEQSEDLFTSDDLISAESINVGFVDFRDSETKGIFSTEVQSSPDASSNMPDLLSFDEDVGEMQKLQIFAPFGNVSEVISKKRNSMDGSPIVSPRDDAIFIDLDKIRSNEKRDPIIERPSAPFKSSDSDEEISMDMIQIDEAVQLSPEVINQCSEEIMIQALEEDIGRILQRNERNVPDIPLLPLFEFNDKQNRHETNQGSLSSEPRIHTDSLAVRRYVEEIFTAALQRREKFQKNIQKPILRSPRDVLKEMQEADFKSNLQQQTLPPVLLINLYLELEHMREESTQRDGLTPRTLLAINNAEHIHNKMIFDSINEALQLYRPYGLKGNPMPWSRNTRHASQKVHLEQVVSEVTDEIEAWSYIQAGKIPTYDLMLSSGMLDEEALQRVREERLANILANEVLEKDMVWTDYEWEETQVALDLGDMLLYHMVIETISILDSI